MQTSYFLSTVKSRMEERPAELWLASESTDKGSYCLYVFPCKAFLISLMFIHPSRDGALNVFSPTPFAFSLHPIFICGTTEGKDLKTFSSFTRLLTLKNDFALHFPSEIRITEVHYCL